jgi:Gpi18-like mannosyltransferase
MERASAVGKRQQYLNGASAMSWRMTAHVDIQAEARQPAKRFRVSPAMQVAAIVAVALNLWAICWTTVPRDFDLFLGPWYAHITTAGPLGAFAHPFSNYTPPYLYLLALASLAGEWLSPLNVVKALSLAGTGFLALALADLLKAAGGKARHALWLFVLPSAVLNAALLAQCDAIWAGACLFAVAAMIRGRTAAALLWCGVAIAFKAQSAFVAPFIIGALIGRRAPLWQWLIPPAVWAAFMVPAWLLGWPAADLATIYFHQAGEFDFAGTLANPWIWGTVFAPDVAKLLFPAGYALAAAAAVAIAACAARSARRPQPMLPLALLSAATLPYLLPKMHERFLFLADVLALALALVRRDRRSIAIAIAVQLTSLSALISYMYFYVMPWPALVGAFMGGAAIVLTWREVRTAA